jgi:hypothetical protein
MFELVEISQGIKNFLKKNLKPFQTFLYLLEEPF